MQRLCTVWSCVTGGEPTRYSRPSFGHRFWGSSVNPNQHLRNVEGWARWVPRMLTEDQKRSRLDISRYLLSRYEDDPQKFMDLIVNQDETWVHHFDPGGNKQSMQWKL